MKKNINLLLVLLIILSSCNKQVSTKNKNLKETPISKVIENKPKKTIKTDYSKLFNTELVGLTKDSKNEKKFYIDFSSACMCNSTSILLKEKKVYFFNYCKDTLPPLSKEPYHTYSIIKKNELNNGLSISLENEQNKKLDLFFKISDNEFIYDLKISGNLPEDYNISDFFTYKDNYFEVEDCEDFDG